MKGTIRARGKCQVCNGNYILVKKLGYICSQCKTVPKRYRFDFHYKGNRLFVYSDKQGKPLDSYERVKDIQHKINAELENHTFDPTRYVKMELEKVYCCNLLDKFLAAKINSVAPSYKTDYKRMVNRAKEHFKTQDARDIRKIDIITYMEYLIKTHNLEGKTLKNHLDLFKTFLRYLLNDLEVIDKVPSFPDIEVKKHKFKWISQDTQIKFYEIINEHIKPIIAFLILHGCRPSEARALRCKNVNLQNNAITISATFSGTTYREKRKGKRSEDVIIPIHPEICDFLSDRVKNNHPEAYVFVNLRTGRHFNKNTLQKEWDRVRNILNIDKSLRLYDATRHSFASQLVNSGTSIYKVSKLLGHSSVKMTEKYAHSDIKSLETEIGKLSLKTVSVPCLDKKRSGK